jgi:threonylcarbamoyladenosine tRNA methylthiotransferase MtaB
MTRVEVLAPPPSRDDAVEVVTFGCRLNAYESEQIRARAAADGLADAVVFNTCAVTGEAVRQARQAIRKARRLRPDARLIVTGCAAQIDPAAFAAMPEVDMVLGNADKAAPGAYAPTLARVKVNDIFSVTQTAGHLIAADPARPIRARRRPARWSTRSAAWPTGVIMRSC